MAHVAVSTTQSISHSFTDYNGIYISTLRQYGIHLKLKLCMIDVSRIT